MLLKGMINTSVIYLVSSELSTESKHTSKSVQIKQEEKMDGSVWLLQITPEGTIQTYQMNKSKPPGEKQMVFICHSLPSETVHMTAAGE